MWTLFLRPIEFFESLFSFADSRHWVFTALLILALTGLSAVQRYRLLNPTAESAEPLSNWNIALITASTLIVTWLVQAFLLGLVSLLKGRSPHLGLNLQIAIWAALPLGLMAGLQLLYYGAGGPVGAEGVSGLVVEVPGYAALSSFAQAVVTALASQITIFWAWSLLLLYLGARHTLEGGWLAALLVVLIWVLLLILVPVVVQFTSTRT